MYEIQEQGISIGPARFRNLKLSKERLINLLSFGYAIKNILRARNQDFQLEIFFCFHLDSTHQADYRFSATPTFTHPT
jgi:hypothetical protein